MPFAVLHLYHTIELDEACVFKEHFRTQMIRITSEIIEFVHIDAREFVRDNLGRGNPSFFSINAGEQRVLLRRETICWSLDLCRAKPVRLLVCPIHRRLVPWRKSNLFHWDPLVRSVASNHSFWSCSQTYRWKLVRATKTTKHCLSERTSLRIAYFPIFSWTKFGYHFFEHMGKGSVT